MNFTLKSVILVVAVAFFISSCSRQQGEGEMNGDKTFSTPEEAVAKAKSDLIGALESNKEIDLGIDLARLREAQQGRLIRYAQVDFGRILTSDSVASLADIVAADKSMIAPFVSDNEVVGIVEVGQATGGWKVAGLGNKAIMDDLNQAGLMRQGNATVTLYEIPNLQLMVYGVRGDGGESYRLNFGRFTLRDSVGVSAFYPVMREQALRFNERFGEELKKGNLVK